MFLPISSRWQFADLVVCFILIKLNTYRIQHQTLNASTESLDKENWTDGTDTDNIKDKQSPIMNLPKTRINLYAPPSVLLLKNKTSCSLLYNTLPTT